MTRLDHINITVRDLKQSIQWYKTIFGFEPVENGIDHLGRHWAIIACNDSMVAMSEYPYKRSASDNGDESHHRVFHFGFRIADLDAWKEKIHRYGLTLNYGGENVYPHSRSWYVNDPSGHTIEVSWSNGQPLQFPGYLE